MKKSELKSRITILKWVIKNLEEKLEISEKWFEYEKKQSCKYATELQYKDKLLKNIISTNN